MRVPVFSLLSLIFISCSTAPKSTPSPLSDLILSPTPWFASVENLKADRCHTQLTDLQDLVVSEMNTMDESLGGRQQFESLYLKRMALQQKISDWYLEDKGLSAECVSLSRALQQLLQQKEVAIGAKLYRDKTSWPKEQSVFMNSDQQLLSNIYLGTPPATSLSDLKNGDVIVTLLPARGVSTTPDRFLSLVRKNEQGVLESLMPVTQSHWARIPFGHPESWVKQSALQVIVLRPRHESSAARVVEKAMKKISQSEFFENRQPAAHPQSWWTALTNSAWNDPELDPELQTLFEWKNYRSLIAP